ncbi:MAG: paraquat-inducible protein A [Pseudomonadota bacterium]
MTKSDPSRLLSIDQLNREWVACPYCDALWKRPVLAEGESAKCGRCHSVIVRNKERSAERTIALMVACLILYAVAVSFPFMKMERAGQTNEISVIDAVIVLWQNSMPGVALLCAAFIVAFPLARIILLLFVGLSLFNQADTGRPHAWSFKTAQMLEPWAMAEIFMVGVIVSLVKVGKLANIHLGEAFWGMFALIVILGIGAAAVCRDTVWQDIRRLPK